MRITQALLRQVVPVIVICIIDFGMVSAYQIKDRRNFVNGMRGTEVSKGTSPGNCVSTSSVS